MSWGSGDMMVLIRCIGTVESDMNYGVVFLQDPITIGFMQWYGTRAGKILEKIKPAVGTAIWAKMPTRIASRVGRIPGSDSSWNSFWVRREEVPGIKAVMTSAQAKAVQNKQAVDDMEAYHQQALKRGLDRAKNPKVFIFWCTIFHQYPVGADRVIKAVGPNASLQAMYNNTIHQPWLRKYKSRYDKAMAVINKYDTSPLPGIAGSGNASGSVEVDPPPAGDNSSSGSNDDDSSGNINIKFLEEINGERYLVYSDNSRDILVKGNGGIWTIKGGKHSGKVPSDDDDDDDNQGGGGGGGGGGGAHLPLAKGTYTLGPPWGATGSWARYHTGQDFRCPSGTPLYAVQDGTVVSDNAGGWAGIHVSIKYGSGASSMYCHMSSKAVKVGDKVKAGQVIGKSGNTGRSFGPHCHFEYYPPGISPGNIYSSKNPIHWLKSLGLNP